MIRFYVDFVQFLWMRILIWAEMTEPILENFGFFVENHVTKIFQLVSRSLSVGDMREQWLLQASKRKGGAALLSAARRFQADLVDWDLA